MLYILFVHEPNNVFVAVNKTKLLWFPIKLYSTGVYYGKLLEGKIHDKSRAKKNDI